MMSIEYLSEDELAIYSTELTEACRSIFGDIIVKATFSQKFYGKPNDYSRGETPSVRLRNKTLDWSQEAFSIEFTSGAIVEFTNSEWASLERLKND